MNAADTSDAFRRLAQLPLADLEREFIAGGTPDPANLSGWEFRGLNCPAATRAIGVRKFVKGFYSEGDDYYGYNIPVRQTRASEEWEYKPNDDTPKRFGFYRVTAVEPTARDNAHPHALLLDYGGMNPRFDPSDRLRDYLVQITDDTFLGAAYYAVGGARIKLPPMFILDRFRKAIDRVAGS